MQILPSTADYIARKSGGTAFEQGDLATPQINIAYGSWYLRYLLRALRRQRAAGARRLQRRRGQGRRVVPRRLGARRGLRGGRRTSRSPRRAATSARCWTCASATASEYRRELGSDERATAGPHRPERVRDRLRRLGHRRRACGSAPRTRSRWQALQPRDRPRRELHRHRARLRARALRAAGRQGGRASARSGSSSRARSRRRTCSWPAPDGIDPDEAFPADHVRKCTERSALQPRHGRARRQQFHVWSDEWVGRGSWLEAIAGAQGRGQDPLLRRLDQRPPARATRSS